MKMIKYFLHISLIFYSLLIIFLETTQKDVFYSIDNSKFEFSYFIKETNFIRSKYIQSEITNFQNFSFSEKNYTLIIESIPPYQDIPLKILEQDSNGELNLLTNVSIIKNISESNIIYDDNHNKFNDHLFEKYINSNKNILLDKKLDLYNDFLKRRKSNYVFSEQIEKVMCNINYNGLKYSQMIEEIKEKKFYENVINFFSINFVTYKETPGVFIKKFVDGYSKNETELTNFFSNGSFLDLSNIKILKIFPSLLYQRHHLFLLEENFMNLYLIRINVDESFKVDYSNNINNITLNFLFNFNHFRHRK